jgi:hypothetical protein
MSLSLLRLRLDGLDHAGGVQRGQLIGREAEDLAQHAVGILAEKRRRSRAASRK